MKNRRHTPEQVIRKLAEGDKLLAQGKTVDEVARHLEISEQTFHRWRNQYGGMKADDAKRLRELGARTPAEGKIVAGTAGRRSYRHVEAVLSRGNSAPDRRRRAGPSKSSSGWSLDTTHVRGRRHGQARCRLGDTERADELALRGLLGRDRRASSMSGWEGAATATRPKRFVEEPWPGCTGPWRWRGDHAL